MNNRNIITNDITEAYKLMNNVMEAMTTALINNPNYNKSKKDWDANYNAACDIINLYTNIPMMFSGIDFIIENESTKVFLGAIKEHIRLLEYIRDKNLLEED